MLESLKTLISDIQTYNREGGKVHEVDIDLLVKQVCEKTDEFLKENNLINASAGNSLATVGVESIGDELAAIGADNITSYVKDCGVPEDCVESASIMVANVLAKHRGANAAQRWSNHIVSMESIDNNFQAADITNLYGPELAGYIAGTESFGVDTDKAVPDLKMDLVVALMKFHADLTAKLLPVRPTSEPCVRYTRVNGEVYDLGDVSSPETQIVDLYEDPSVVDTTLKQIVPLNANDPALVPADGQLVFGKEVNILELSIDTSKPGYSKINRTDLVADGVRVDAVYITLHYDDGAGTTYDEQFKIDIPEATGRLTRNANNADVAERTANFKYSQYLTKGALLTNGNPSNILNLASNTDEGLLVTLLVSAKLNLKNGVGFATCGVSYEGHQVNGQALSSGWATAVGNIQSADADTYELDAKFSEENMRKTDIAVRIARQSFSYDIPTGRNYVVDYSFAQDDSQTNAAVLTKVIRIGQGRRVLKAIEGTLDNVATMVEDYKSGRTTVNPASYFVAGAKVRPYVISDTLNLSTVNGIKDADRSGDIKEHTLLFLNSIISKIAAESFFNQQLVPGTAPHYTGITSNYVLDNVIAQRHIHNHLDNADNSVPGVEYRLVLPNGAIIDFITTTDTIMSSKILIIPSLPESKESELNFGHEWDYGTMVGHYTVNGSDRNANNRLFANTRELPVPTNPIGAIIDVSNIDQAVFR